MKRDIETINSTRSFVLYEFDTEEVALEKEKVLKEYCAETSISGFRKGKAPKNIVLSKFSSDIESRTKSMFLNKAFEEADKAKQELNLLTVVDFEIENKNERIFCKLIYDIKPDIKLPDYKSVTLTPFSDDVTDEEIESEFLKVKKRHSTYNLVDREIVAGDYVKVSYNGCLEDGSEISTIVPDHTIWGKQVGTWEEAGNKDVGGVQSIIQGIIGHKKGDTGKVEEFFPEDFNILVLAGKKAVYTFEILEVRERVDPEINEEFLKQYEVNSVDELKEHFRTYLSRNKRTQGLVKQRDEIVNFLSSAAEFEIPESVLKREIKILIQMFVDSQVRNGASIKDLKSHMDELSEGLNPMAVQRGKAGLMLDKIAEEEKIEIENKDIEAMIWQDAMFKRININNYINDLKKDRNLLNNLRMRALRGKVLDFILKINSKEISDEKIDSEKDQTK